MAENESSKVENTGSPEESLNDSVAFSTINDLTLLKRISESDGDYMKKCYKRYYDARIAIARKDDNILRRSRNLINEILAEQIILEKIRIDESEEISTLRKLEDERDLIQKETEMAEQRDTLAKFELTELKSKHEELKKSLVTMRRENTSIVEPVLAKLTEEIKATTEQFQMAKETFEKETNQKKVISAKLDACQVFRKEKAVVLSELEQAFHRSCIEPARITKQSEAIENAVNNMKAELKHVHKEVAKVQDETSRQADRKSAADALRISLDAKVGTHKELLEETEKEVVVVRSALESDQSISNDLVTRKIELNLRKKESENLLRISLDEQNTARKSYEVLKRQLKNKRIVADEAKKAIPTLESCLLDEQMSVKGYRDEQAKLKFDLKQQRLDVDTHIIDLLQQEGLEQSKKTELESVLNEVEAAEDEVVRLMSEKKRQGTLLGVLSAQRDIKARESSRVENLTKSCGELSNRFKEFSALYEVVKNERNKYVSLIQSSTQALAEMREKIRILQNEVEILGNESSTKDKALSKEKGSHQQAKVHRDSLRQDMNKYLSAYKEKRLVVEQQIQEIDKLNNIINNMEKQMLDLKTKYEKAVEERNVNGIQLIDRNDELCIIYERSNQQLDAFKKGEIELLRKEEELRMLRLQTEDIKRRYLAAQKRVPDIEKVKKQIRELEEKLINERKRADELSAELEDPKNVDRWRPLEGDDPSLEQLAVKLKVFEERLDGKREQLLEKELILKEITALTDKLRNQAISKRDVAKNMADQLNSFQTRIRDTTKRMLASVSELSMYQATALRLQQEKVRCDKSLEDAMWKFDHGEAPCEDALKEWNRAERRNTQNIADTTRLQEEMMLVQPSVLLKTTAEPRPTAYIPEEMAIPKPYGASAPFKPTEPGSTMRHIRVPNPKQIEI